MESGIEELEVPNSIARVADHAFHGCASLRRVTFGKDSALEEVGSHAFAAPDSLMRI